MTGLTLGVSDDSNEFTINHSGPGPGMLIEGGRGHDVFHITSIPPPDSLWAIGGEGFDIVFGPEADTTWDFYSDEDVLMKRTNNPAMSMFVTEMEYLVGGSGDDVFALREGVTYFSNVDGAGGVNRLDYSRFTSDVYVNFKHGTASRLGYFTNIQNATGGAGHDILVGNGGNILVGGAGRDLLIAGTTAYDDDAATLEAILQYWTSPDDYDTRVANLLTGNGTPLLDATTVFSNGGGNLLSGGGEADLYFSLADLDTIDDQEAGEGVVWL